MSLLFQDLSSQMVRKGLQDVRESIWDTRAEMFEEYQDWYMGGYEVLEHLIRHKGEDDIEWKERRDRACNPNFLRMLADKIIDSVYGGDVIRNLGETASEAQQEILEEVLESAHMLAVQLKLCQSIVVLGDAWLNVAWRERDATLAVYNPSPSMIWYAPDPNDPYRVAEVVERREDLRQSRVAGSKQPYIYWVYNEREGVVVGDDGLPIPLLDGMGRPQPNPFTHTYGRVPYVHFIGRPVVGSTDGLSYIRDLVPIQRLIFNRSSDHDTNITYQTHGVLVLRGNDLPTVQSGPRRYIGLDADGDAKFINPNAPVDQVQRTIMDLVEWMFQTASVPASLVSGGTANSGLQLAIEMRPFVQLCESIRTIAKVGEADLLKCICAVGNAYGLGLPDPVTLKPEIEFPDNILPQDEDVVFQRDLTMLNNIPPLMTRADFLVRHVDKIKTQDDAASYEDELDAESGAGSSAWGSSSGSGPSDPVPPGGGGDQGGGGGGIKGGGDMSPGGGEGGIP